MRLKSLPLFGLLAAAAIALHGQPVYWSTDATLDCTGVEGPAEIANGEYACYVSGTFVWLAAGGEWSTAIRVAAPASNPVGVDYTLYDASGNNLTLDYNMGSGTATSSNNDINFALAANQPAEVDVLGAAGGGPSYSATETGSVYAVIYCPDAITCASVNPQLIYSALPSVPWSLSVPIAWDFELNTQWSAEGIDDGGQHLVSLVIYNENTTAAQFNVDIYNSAGTLVATGTTPSIPPLQSLGSGTYGEGGTYGILLRDIPLTGSIPSGIFKILIDGGSSNLSAVEVLQFNGQSGTSLQISFDTEPSTDTNADARSKAAKVRPLRTVPKPKGVFPPLRMQ